MSILEMDSAAKTSVGYEKSASKEYRFGERVLREKRSRKHPVAGSVVIDFDILEKTGARSGVMQITLSENENEIHLTGNLGGYLLEGKEDPGIIYSAAIYLERILKAAGIQKIRSVSLENNSAQIDAMKMFDMVKEDAFEDQGYSYVAYEKQV